MAERWVERPDGSTWGDYGDDDQLGRLNLITPERRLAAAQEIREGLAFVLSLPLDLPGPGAQAVPREPPRLRSLTHNTPLADFFDAEGAIDIGNDDAVTIVLQYATQWDSLAHIGAFFDADGDGKPEKVYYNGYRADVDIVGLDVPDGPRARALGIENAAATGVQGRGVLVDLHREFGDRKTIVGHDQMMRVLEAQQIIVEPGDILCVHTGFGDAVLSIGHDKDATGIDDAFCVLDGNDPGLRRWITDSQIAALCCDNATVEAKPDGPCEPGTPILPLHHHCIFKLGCPLGELWYLGELARWLAAAGRSRFFLTAPPLRLPGAVGSPLTPVATV